MLKISVVTASYNQGVFIKKCLDSIKSQRGNFFIEHIILDNCSTDNTAAHLRQYKNNSGDVDVKIFTEPDAGQTSAINKGFSLATGDIVCWLNTDEWPEENAFSAVADYFKKNPEVDVVFGNCSFVDVKGALLKNKREFFFSESMLLYYGCFIPSCTTFVRRKIIDAGLVLNSEFKVTMDFDWYVRISKAGYHFAHLPITLASFTWHDNNISSVFVERRKLERRLVQDRYSGVRGPGWLRTVFYWCMKYLWISVRVINRFFR